MSNQVADLNDDGMWRGMELGETRSYFDLKKTSSVMTTIKPGWDGGGAGMKLAKLGEAKEARREPLITRPLVRPLAGLQASTGQSMCPVRCPVFLCIPLDWWSRGQQFSGFAAVCGWFSAGWDRALGISSVTHYRNPPVCGTPEKNEY